MIIQRVAPSDAIILPLHAAASTEMQAQGPRQLTAPSAPLPNLIRVDARPGGPALEPTASDGPPAYDRRAIDDRPRSLTEWQTALRAQGRLTDALVLQDVATFEGVDLYSPISRRLANTLVQQAYQPLHYAQVMAAYGAPPSARADASSDWSRFVARMSEEQRARLNGNRMCLAELANIRWRNDETSPTEADFLPVFRPFGGVPRGTRWTQIELQGLFTLAGRISDYHAAVAMMTDDERYSFENDHITREGFQRFLTAATTPATRAALEQRFGTNINASATPEEKARLERGEMTPSEFRWITVRNAQRRSPYTGSGTMP